MVTAYVPAARVRAHRPGGVLAWAPAVVGGLALGVTLVDRHVAGRSAPGGGVGDDLWLGAWLTWAVVGSLLLRRASAPRGLGVLFAVLGTTTLLCAAGDDLAQVLVLRDGVRGDGVRWLVLLTQVGFGVAFATACGLTLLVFPTGRLASPRWRPARRVAVAVPAIVALAVVVTPGRPDADIPVQNPLGVGALHDVARGALGLCYLAIIVLFACGFGSLRTRWRAGAAAERRQVAALGVAASYALALTLVALAFALAGRRPSALLGDLLEASCIAAVPAATVTAMVRHGLYDAEVALRRTATYLVVSAVVVAGYSGVVLVLGAVLVRRQAFGASLVATGLVAVAFGPLKETAQGVVDRLLYGSRRTPYTALAQLGRRVAGTTDPATLLVGVVEEVAAALRVPYVGLAYGGGPPRVQHGTPVPDTLDVPLVFGGGDVGRLLVAPRGPREHFGEADRRLLSDIGRYVAGAVHAVALTDHLRESREQLVLAREEERRRLRRDLHDGLGPRLAAVTLQLDAARRAADDERLPLLEESKAEVRACVGEVRRLVAGLRPPALDELGLAETLHQQARALSSAAQVVDVEVEVGDASLPAAVEVATVRIVAEALTNVTRHAGACRCRVVVHRGDDGLVVQVDDDGTGLRPPRSGGLGLRSMRERAEELGGTFEVGASPLGGTRVAVRLPA